MTDSHGIPRISHGCAKDSHGCDTDNHGLFSVYKKVRLIPNFISCLQKTMENVLAQRRNRLQLLNWQLQLNQQQNVNNMLMVQVLQMNRRVQRIRRQRRTVWVRPWLERRVQLGQYSRLMDELRVEDVRSFRNFLRMEPAMFQEVVDRLIPRITKVDTFCRKALAPGLKLAITL